MRTLICKLLGHKPPVHYGKVIPSVVDGIGREHAFVEAECPRCGKRYHVVDIHLIQTSRDRDELKKWERWADRVKEVMGNEAFDKMQMAVRI